MKRILLFLFFLLPFSYAFSQDRNSIWCFGDSSGIDFSNLSNPLPIHSAAKSRGSCVSMSDSLGQLLFYAYTRATVSGKTTLVKNKNHQLMANGNNIIGEGWYQELTIVPAPGSSNLYYLFTGGVTGSSQPGLYYSVIDMSLNGGLGSVIQKNVQLQSYYSDDCVQAIKHGNGRDWWIISREWNNGITNAFYEYLITPSGVSSVNSIQAGTPVNSGFYHFTFSKSGDKIIALIPEGLIELFDFDRCTGLINYNQTISTPVTSNFPYYWSAAFSPNQTYLYIASYPDPANDNYLFQFNLQASNIFNSIDTLWHLSSPTDASGFLKLAPDDKIYFACAWNDGVNFNYPYPDTAFNSINNNLSVINRPDSAGDSCLFTPFSFNLGAGRCYWGLPNNPDYEMGAVAPCDSLTLVEQLSPINNSELFVFYHSARQIVFINAKDLKGKNYSLHVFDLMGKEIYKEEGKVSSYFTKDLNCEGFAKGMYIVMLQTESEKLVKRFVKE